MVSIMFEEIGEGSANKIPAVKSLCFLDILLERALANITK